ncbi:MAG: hypothetical protein Q8N91_04405 [Candidatus Omnitrophota bacterium]|nr:hypothetical protein [Candidatus Omnitrophota bacterium]
MPYTESLKAVNKEVLRRINREVSVRASRFANALLSGVFRAIFQIEKAYEFAEPAIFQPEHEPDRMLLNRLDGYRLSNLPMAIANEDVLVSRYQLFTEYDFVVVADVSQSMMLYWWGIYGGDPMPGHTAEELTADVEAHKWKIPGDRTKLFLLKYTLASFLHAARANEFFSYVLLAGDSKIELYDSRREPNLEETLLRNIDEHYGKLVTKGGEERPQLQEALRQVLARRRRAIVLCISDFNDCLQHINDKGGARLSQNDIILPLAEISSRHRLLVLQINHRLEHEPQAGEATFDVKNCPYLNGEIRSEQRGYAVSDRDLVLYGEKVDAWKKTLGVNFGKFGIKWQSLRAGKDDENVDTRIYELGVQTGR